jgi:hypothetical protein
VFNNSIGFNSWVLLSQFGKTVLGVVTYQNNTETGICYGKNEEGQFLAVAIVQC